MGGFYRIVDANGEMRTCYQPGTVMPTEMIYVDYEKTFPPTTNNLLTENCALLSHHNDRTLWDEEADFEYFPEMNDGPNQ